MTPMIDKYPKLIVTERNMLKKISNAPMPPKSLLVCKFILIPLQIVM